MSDASDEAKQVLAFIFKRSGKKTLPASDVYLAISMELQWCSPKEAKAFVKQSVAHNLLIEKDHGVTPSFEFDKVSIPTGFSPSNTVFTEPLSSVESLSVEDIISSVIKRLEGNTKRDSEEIRYQIEQIAKDKNIMLEVAAVFLAKKHDCKIDDLIGPLKDVVFTSEKRKA
jgi:hypothetical protein